MSATRAPGESFEAIVQANAFMTLATADAAGRPWASPVWFATDDCLQFIWASKPHARHSTNLALRPEISIAIFDSGQPPGTGLGVYMTARAELVPRTDFESALAIYWLWRRTKVCRPGPRKRSRLPHGTASIAPPRWSGSCSRVETSAFRCPRHDRPVRASGRLCGSSADAELP